MSDKSTAASGGIGFGGLLTILFIALKLTHVINWSWWWVLSPLWIGPLTMIVFLIVAGIIMLAGAVIVAILDR
jgi:hypothetical protein